MNKYIMFHREREEAREVDASESRKLADQGWMTNPDLVAVFHPGQNAHKNVLRADLTSYLNRGFYADPTWVFHPEHGKRVVPAEEARKLYGQGWYDSPAKFPGGEDGVPTRADKKPKPPQKAA